MPKTAIGLPTALQEVPEIPGKSGSLGHANYTGLYRPNGRKHE